MVISARGLESQKIEALDSGAEDYLVKPFGIGELLARIRVLLRRQSALESARYTLGDVQVEVDRRLVLKAGAEVHLSPIEFGLLLALLRADGKLVSHRKLLQAIWGPEAVDQTHYLRVYMGKLRAKLEQNPATPELILTELGVGYRANL
jgi:two-component system KDP operon response regulator KdpE